MTEKMKADVVVIGGGVIGTAIARELARFDLDIILIEKEADLACGTSKANSGIIHAGYNASSNTLKGRMNVKANSQFDKISDDLNVPFERIGSLVVGFNEDDLKKLKKMKENGEKQGIKGLKIVKQDKLMDMEPKINPEAQYGLYAPTAGIISPYELAIAYGDNAALNGVNIMLNTELTGVINDGNKLKAIKTNKGIIEAKLVINSAGVFADKIAQMGGEKMKIKPRKGEYHLFDKEYGSLAQHVLFPIPNEMSKGILVTPTVHG
ncbi:MAG: NAD(P)/FAD-dependent oxidoreductase, partial [Bacillota bacterium]